MLHQRPRVEAARLLIERVGFWLRQGAGEMMGADHRGYSIAQMFLFSNGVRHAAGCSCPALMRERKCRGSRRETRLFPRAQARGLAAGSKICQQLVMCFKIALASVFHRFGQRGRAEHAAAG